MPTAITTARATRLAKSMGGGSGSRDSRLDTLASGVRGDKLARTLRTGLPSLVDASPTLRSRQVRQGTRIVNATADGPVPKGWNA